MTAQPVPLPDMAPNVSESLSAPARRITMRVGDRVSIQRDETLYPSKGTWPQLRCRTGTIVEINTDRKRPHLTEYGVVFGAVRERPDRNGKPEGGMPTWFKIYELRPCP